MISQEWARRFVAAVGLPGARSALAGVEELYQTIHGRSVFDDLGAVDWIEAITTGRVTLEQAELDIRKSDEHRERSEAAIRALYRELLLRDPGPAAAGDAWRDPAALGYVDDLQLGLRSLEELREEIKSGDEYKQKHSRAKAGALRVVNFALSDVDGGSPDDRPMLGASFFYAMSPGVKREQYLRGIDGLAAAGVEFLRFAGSTFTWDNPIRLANVIPFKPGNAYRHEDPESVDAGKMVSWLPSDDHFRELDWRLEQAAARGLHVQYTVFWGGFQPLFTLDGAGKQRPPGEGGYRVMWERVEPYCEYVGRFFDAHPAHALEIMNEADHGHHLARFGWAGRKEFIRRCAAAIRKHHPEAVLSVSDGGHEPQVDGNRSKPAPEGSPYFDYHELAELDYWNVHYPRETVEAQGIPRWCRGPWHLYQDRAPFRAVHRDKGYGRSDESIFLSTAAEAQKWGYRGSTRDWRMYALSMWVTTMAGAGFTIHDFGGFFAKGDAGTREIFRRAARAWRDITAGFPWQGATPYNAGWAGSPVRDFRGPFKVFSIASGLNRKSILTTVLNPSGTIEYELEGGYEITVFDIEGRTLKVTRGAGRYVLELPIPSWSSGAIVRLERI